MNTGEYSSKDICAVVVSFNPKEIIIKNVEALLPQIGKCVVIENGSTEKQFLKPLGNKETIVIKYLETNTGIAHALNEGLDFCVKNGYKLMLTMDQDTILSSNCVDKLLAAMIKYKADSVGINWDVTIKKDKEVNYLITSGNLVAVEAAKSIGGFDEKLFIDSVDFDFSLRLRDKGFKIVKVADAKAKHNLGEKQGNSGYVTHSANRYYYIYRNHFYLCHKHWKKHPVFIAKKNIALLIDLCRILIFDSDKNEKVKQLVNGRKEYKSMN